MTANLLRGYDRAGLDAQYNNRAKVPDFERHIARWTQQGVHARATLPVRADQVYDPMSGQTLNVFEARGSRSPSPVLIYLHGGYWMALGKASTDCIALGFTPHGVAVVNVDYSLMPAVRMDELVRQCRAAVAWTVANAAGFGGDPNRVWVSGHSAGGHLAMMAAARTGPTAGPVASGQGAPVLAGGLSFSGLHDLEPIARCYLNDTLAMDDAEARRNSPIHLTPPSSGRWHLVLGGREGPEYLRQSADLAACWGSTDERRMTMEVVADAHHFSLVDPLADPDSSLVRRLCPILLAQPQT